MQEASIKPNRRTFLGKVVVGATTVTAGVIGVEPLFQPERSQANAAQGSNQRANDCAKLRRDAALAGQQATPSNLQHPANVAPVLRSRVCQWKVLFRMSK